MSKYIFRETFVNLGVNLSTETSILIYSLWLASRKWISWNSRAKVTVVVCSIAAFISLIENWSNAQATWLTFVFDFANCISFVTEQFRALESRFGPAINKAMVEGQPVVHDTWKHWCKCINYYFLKISFVIRCVRFLKPNWIASSIFDSFLVHL